MLGHLGWDKSYMKYRLNVKRMCHLILKYPICLNKWMTTFFSFIHPRQVSLWSLTSHSFPLYLSSLSPCPLFLFLTSLIFGNHHAVLGEPVSTPPLLPPLIGIPSFSLIVFFQLLIAPLILFWAIFLFNLFCFLREPQHSPAMWGQPLLMVYCPTYEPKMIMIVTKLSEKTPESKVIIIKKLVTLTSESLDGAQNSLIESPLNFSTSLLIFL